jgi:hypothetical protein
MEKWQSGESHKRRKRKEKSEGAFKPGKSQCKTNKEDCATTKYGKNNFSNALTKNLISGQNQTTKSSYTYNVIESLSNLSRGAMECSRQAR